MRIGIVSDTHIPEAGPELPSQLREAFGGCELILHCGDLHDLSVVDHLEQFAPTLAARGNGDTYEPDGLRPGVPEDPRVADVHVLELRDFRIGLTHDLELAQKLPDADAGAAVVDAFGSSLDIALSGHTHVPFARGLANGATLLNPGSATMPYGYTHLLGTVALLDIGDGGFEFTIVDLLSGRAEVVFQGPSPGTRWQGARPGPRATGARHA